MDWLDRRAETDAWNEGEAGESFYLWIEEILGKTIKYDRGFEADLRMRRKREEKEERDKFLNFMR